MGHGAQRLDIQLARQVHVAGTDEAPGEITLEHADHVFLHPVGKAPARAEIGHLQVAELVGCCMG
ncbi:hypothetical protein D9M73_198470 [compost metagenome]